MFKEKEKVRVYAKLGNMREEKWIDGIILESNFEDENELLVETRFQKVWVHKKDVKHLNKLDYDSENHVWPALEEFKSKYWDDLKHFVRNALETFFPETKMVVDEEEKIISVDGFSIEAGIVERKTLVSFSEVAVWCVGAEIYDPGDRNNPPSCDLEEIGNSASVIGTVRLLIESMMKDKIGSYFDSIPCEYEDEQFNFSYKL